MYKEHLNLKKQLEKMKLEYETSKQQLESDEAEKGPITRLLNEEQRRLYDRIIDMNARMTNNLREMELKELI